MGSRRTKLLKVGNEAGERVEAEVFDYGNNSIMIRVAFIPEVLKDKPKFAKDGRIIMTVSRAKYADAILAIETYLETLFLKELNDADVPASSGAGADSRGNEENGTGDDASKDSGKGNTASIHSSSRRKKSAESSGRGAEAVTLDEVGSEEIE